MLSSSARRSSSLSPMITQQKRYGSAMSSPALQATPRFLEQAKSELVDSDPIFIKVAVEENEGNVDLIQDTVAAAVAKHPDLKTRFDRVAPPTVKALKDFSQWLQDDLEKRKTDRTWRLGKELYAEKFRLVMETDITPDQVLARCGSAIQEDARRDARTRAAAAQAVLP